MKRRIVAFSVVAGMAVMGLGCQERGVAGLTDADTESIRRGAEAFVSGVNAGAWSDVAAIYALDAALLPPNGEAVNGRTAIRAWFEAFPPVTAFKTERLEVYGRGDLAVVRGTFSMNILLPGSTSTVQDRGKYIEIWRKGVDDSWMLVRDIFNSELPAPPSPIIQVPLTTPPGSP